MASAANSLRLVCRSCRNQRPTQRIGAKVFVAWKSVSSGGGAVKESRVKLDEGPKPTPFDHWEVEERERHEKYRFMPPSRVARSLLSDDLEIANQRELDGFNWATLDDATIREEKDKHREILKPARKIVKPDRNAFWDDEEPDNDLITGDDTDEFDENDMTDIAHAKLEEQREQREYARLAIWEMPRLAELAKPFEPPTAEQPLRFRFTSYMGEYHPAEKKVVVEFSPADFGLTEVQEMKMKKLAGPRYNPEKEVIKMSCESFEHQAQNKRFLAETVQQLLTEAKDPTDTFEDVPLDLRHHKFKVKPKFPLEWRMSDERLQQIHAYRQEVKRLEAAKVEEGTFIDGLAAIEQAHNARRASESVPVPLVMGRTSTSRPRGSRF